MSNDKVVHLNIYFVHNANCFVHSLLLAPSTVLSAQSVGVCIVKQFHIDGLLLASELKVVSTLLFFDFFSPGAFACKLKPLVRHVLLLIYGKLLFSGTSIWLILVFSRSLLSLIHSSRKKIEQWKSSLCIFWCTIFIRFREEHSFMYRGGTGELAFE